MIESAQRVRYEALRSLAFGSVTNNYVAVGTQFQNPVRLLSIQNNTDADLLISFDGVTDMDFVGASGTSTFDYGANAILPVGKFEQSAYQYVYVKADSALPTQGKVCVTVVYASAY